jgi:hypothetical protein
MRLMSESNSKSLESWDAFERELAFIRESFSASPYPLLFRGQDNSSYALTTTLERAGCEGMSFLAYNRLISRIKPALETLTDVLWDVSDHDPALETQLTDDYELLSLHRFPPVALYRYMAYLRHHGFPSPLLDWTISPYVAAFFAFRDSKPGIEKRSIYVYCEMPEGTKGGAVGGPAIHPIGRYVRTHRRHEQQQSDYTLCGQWQAGRGWSYIPHEGVFNTRVKQDVLLKLDLPSAERTRILGRLDQYNLNAFSLFSTEESLLETMWVREQVLKMNKS